MINIIFINNIMKKIDIENIVNLLNEKYEGEWEIHIVEGSLPEGTHKAFQSGYKLRIGDQEAKVEEGIRGINFPFIARVEGDKVFLKYV